MNDDPNHPCLECEIARGAVKPRDLPALTRGLFLVHPKVEAAPVPGWFVVAPRRHVERLDALTPEELAALGPLLAETAAALREETPCERVYTSIFAEVLHHLHVHVIVRPPELAPELRGPRIFLAPTPGGPAQASEVDRRVMKRLSAASN